MVAPEPLLDIALSHRQGSFGLEAEFTAPARGVTALFGPSGSGKTTVINAIAGLFRPGSGHIRLGETVFFDSARGIDIPTERRRVGYVFQDARLFPHMTVRDNLLYGLRRIPAAERQPAGPVPEEAVIAMLGLSALLGRRPGALSGGEKQRVALGRALLSQPRVLLMDEPLASLDAGRKAEILPYIERLRDTLAIPVVLVSHAMDEVVRLAETVVLIRDGRVVAAGPLTEVFGRLDTAPALEDEGSGAVLLARVSAHDDDFALTVLTFDGGTLTVPRLPLAVGAALRLRIPARDVILALVPPQGLSVHNVLSGTLLDLQEDGAAVEVRLALGRNSVLLARITRHSAWRMGLTPGMPLHALVKSVAFDRRSLMFGAPAGSLLPDGVVPL